MIQAKAIEELADVIARQFQPEKVILFGSYAYGTPTEDSDADLMVVVRHRDACKKAVAISAAIEHRFSIDILVRSPAEVRRRLNMRDFFMMEIVETVIVLHDANDSRVGEKGRSRLRRRLRAAAISQAQPA
jgi:predicted nucleotidyltransferase